jgi:hypothetical protein
VKENYGDNDDQYLNPIKDFEKLTISKEQEK